VQERFYKEGNVGGGTGMMCLGFKGDRYIIKSCKNKDSTYTLGVFVQSISAEKRNLTIAGVPVGKELIDTIK
jgi:L-aminopeptidase/D-esterase-like protein